jgi:dihydroorotate dehydrogenase electron transfer subunit
MESMQTATSYTPAQAIHLPRAARITRIIRESRKVATFVLDDAVAAEPGQFIMAWLPGTDEKPLSIAWPDPLAVTVAAVGPFSRALHACRPGDRVGWRGPYGRPYRIREDEPALLVGGGYGGAPLYFLADRMLAQKMDVTVALGGRQAEDLIFIDRYQERGVPLLLATEDGSAGISGFVTVAVEQYLASQRGRPPAIYACGPEGLLAALFEICRRRELPGQLSVERYMKCGFGLCGQCALDDLLVCLDGPVFDWQELAGKADFGHWHRGTTGRRQPL